MQGATYEIWRVGHVKATWSVLAVKLTVAPAPICKTAAKLLTTHGTGTLAGAAVSAIKPPSTATEQQQWIVAAYSSVNMYQQTTASVSYNQYQGMPSAIAPLLASLAGLLSS